MKNNTVRKIKSNYFVYAYYNYGSYTIPPSGYPGMMSKVMNNVTDSIDLAIWRGAGTRSGRESAALP